jgi:hypothetical protein
MAYRQFLLVMLVEMALFAAFVLAGVLMRKRREKHRAMMLLATLSILAGATVRMPVLFSVFGEAGWTGIFGRSSCSAPRSCSPVPSSPGVSIARSPSAMRLVVFYVGACHFAVSDTWSYLSAAVFST